MAVTVDKDQYYLIYFFFILLICLISSKLYQQIFHKPTTHLNLPPSPPALPIIGHLHLLTPALYNSFFNLSSKYGPLLYLCLGAARCLLVSSASMASEVFKTHDLAFSSRPIFTFADKLLYGTSGFITAPYGDYWRFMKKLCVTELLGVKQLERSRTIRLEELRRLVAKVIKKATSKDQVLDVGGELMRLTNNVTCRMVMSTRCSGDDDDGEAERCKELVKKSFELAAKLCFGDVLGPLKKLGFWIYGKQALNLSKRYDELLEKILKEHEERDGEREEDKNLMDILLKVYKDKKAEVKITRIHIKAFLLDLFMAGTDTTAEAMQWTIAEILNHPDAFMKVRQEIESVIGRTRLVEETDIPSLPYLQAVVKETLRLYPPGPVTTRECRQNCRIKGFDIPEKTAVSINLYAIMRDPDAWDNPEEFRLERFLIPSRDQEQKLFNFVPFGAGRRGCPGSMLAFAVMKTVIAAMVQCFDWNVNKSISTRIRHVNEHGSSTFMSTCGALQPICSLKIYSRMHLCYIKEFIIKRLIF